MGWFAIRKDGTYLEEDKGYPRPVEEGNEGNLLVVGHQDYGHSVAADLTRGQMLIDFTQMAIQNGQVDTNSKTVIQIAEDTNIVDEYKHLEQQFVDWYNCGKTKFIDWYRCNRVKDHPEHGEIECDAGTPDPEEKVDEDGHPRLKISREVACDQGHTDPTLKCEQGHDRKQVFHEDGTPVKVRNDILHPLIWRPIWFNRNYLMGPSIKVIGAQTTTPVELGSKNVKMMVMLYPDGRIGITQL